MMPMKGGAVEASEMSELREDILLQTQKFLTRHGLRLKVRRLPIIIEDADKNRDKKCESHKENENSQNSAPVGRSKDGVEDASEEKSGKNSGKITYPLYHFVTRQKQHIHEQLLRNRSQYLSPFNSANNPRNVNSPFILRNIPEHLKDNLTKMANDFDDPEFSGVWLSLHTKPFLTDTEFGNLARSKIVGWGLIEVLTTNERCLKALWVHPKLSAKATTDLLRGFLPRVMLEAFELPSPPEGGREGKFFYTWVNDFDSLPRQAWLLLTSPKWLGLPKHIDNTAHPVKSHIDSFEVVAKSQHELSEEAPDSDPQISSNPCGCAKNAKWENIDDVLVGCSETAMYTKWKFKRFSNLIPYGICPELKDDAEGLPLEGDETEPNTDPQTVREAELVSLSDSDVGTLLGYIYGSMGVGRIKGVDQYIGPATEPRKRDDLPTDKFPIKRQRKARIKE